MHAACTPLRTLRLDSEYEAEYLWSSAARSNARQIHAALLRWACDCLHWTAPPWRGYYGGPQEG